MIQKKVYVIFWNLVGLHPLCTFSRKKNSCGEWWWECKENDAADYNPKKPIDIRGGCASIAFMNKREAKKAYAILDEFRAHIKRHI